MRVVAHLLYGRRRQQGNKKEGNRMENREVKKVWERGNGEIKKRISYSTEEIEYQEIVVKAEFEGNPTPEKIKQIAEVIEEAAKKVMKIVEEW